MASQAKWSHALTNGKRALVTLQGYCAFTGEVNGGINDILNNSVHHVKEGKTVVLSNIPGILWCNPSTLYWFFYNELNKGLLRFLGI